MNETSNEIAAYLRSVLRRIPHASAERDRIAEDVRTHILERMEAGQTVNEAIEHMGPAEEVARAYLQDIRYPLASLSRRMGAFLIDLLLGVVLVVPALSIWFGVALGPFWEMGGSLWELLVVGALVFGLAGVVLSVLYFPALEARYGQTLGKRLMGLCVTTESGEQIGWGSAIVRRLPLFLEIFWLDALFALFTRKRQRAFDLVAKTLVVRCR